MNRSKLKIGVEQAKTARLCCRGLIIAHFEQALVEQQIKKLIRWKNNNNNQNEKFDYPRICLLFSRGCI